MPPQATSATVLIIPLILNALSVSAPPPQTWAPSIASAPGIIYKISEQPHHDPGSSGLPMGICSGHFSTTNTTDSSVLLLLPVSLSSQGGRQPLGRYGRSSNSKANNRTAPWTSLSLQLRVEPEPVGSNPFGLNVSLNVVSLFNFSDPNVLHMHMSPVSSMTDVEGGQINGAPALYAFVLCSSDSNGYFIPSLFQDGRRYTYTRKVSRYRERVNRRATQPRKLLAAPAHSHSRHSSTNLLGHRPGCVRIRKKHVLSAAGIAVGLALLSLLCFIAALLICWCRKPKQSAELCPSGPRQYSHRELAAATCGFSDEQKIGRGGFGPVYRGYLRDLDCHVAVKVLRQGSSFQEQGTREFQAEVKVMTRLRHRNVVQLLGWCDAPGQGAGGLMLVYEFVPNGSLDKHLYDPQRLQPWSDRYKIALGVGSAILYLHTECEQCVLHGDIKPANILLDPSYNAKLGDFGLARLVDHGTDSHTTQVVAGTPGYMDPEFVHRQRPSAEYDVYSFGVLLLEIATGRRPTTRQSNGAPVLLNWVRDMYHRNSILRVVDRRLDGEFDDQQTKRVLVAGLWCTHQDRSQRPSIVDVMDLLRRQHAELPVLHLVKHSPDEGCSLEEIAFHDLSAEDSAFENSTTTETVYHSSKDSTGLIYC